MSANPLVSPKDYLRLERLAETKSELHRGHVVAMSGASRVHGRIVMNLSGSLHNQLRSRPCNNYAGDLRVGIPGRSSYFYPDIVVTCGHEEFEDEQKDTLLNPTVVIEVLSPSTEAYDRGLKFRYYQSIPSLREYLLVSQAVRRFEVYRRQDDGTWIYESLQFGDFQVELRSVNCVLTSLEAYEKTDAEGE